MPITGYSLIGINSEASGTTSNGQGCFRALDATTGAELETTFHSASAAEVENAVQLAHQAFFQTKQLSGQAKAAFLRRIASGLEAEKETIVATSNRETALPRARLEGELGRTTGQLRLFADLLEEGSWVEARIDPAAPNRQPLPKPDIRSMLRAIGPVVIFGASNFPLAFSVAGGDTASALAAGCPVIVKAHPAHPTTSALVGNVIAQAARECEMPEGIFSLLFDNGYEVGMALVKHPLVKAVGFTGSRRAGLALMEAAANRSEPIPVFAEMSSVNPIFITPAALEARSSAIATSLHGAVTMGVGQFCTNPGLVFLPEGAAGDAFLNELAALFGATVPGTMLTSGICRAYRHGAAELAKSEAILLAKVDASDGLAGAALFEISIEALLAQPSLMAEVFGPSTLVVRYQVAGDLNTIAIALEGQLTATLQIEVSEIANYSELIGMLETKAGRLLVNGFPTGVEVGHAMVHGGPFPSTSDGQSTSVGTRAILRFARPVCFQNFPEAALPPELQNANPLGLFRLLNGRWTDTAIGTA